MTRSSRLAGFYKLSVDERRRLAADALGIDVRELMRALGGGGLDVATADKTIENVVGTFAMPFAIGLNLQINGADYLAPMVVEEPSVVAAASNAAKMIRAGGGFRVDADEPLMIAQVHLDEVRDVALANARILAAQGELIAAADRAVPGLVVRGGGARELAVRDLGDGMVVVHVIVDCRDAMGANLVNTVAEAIAPTLASLSGGKVAMRILSNLSDRRNVRVRVRVPAAALAIEGFRGEEVRDGIVRASRFAEADPYRAATHNKGIMNGIDAVVIATGNDWRAVEAGAHAYAARRGRYEPLCTWRVGDDGMLEGCLEMPLALGIVGGPARVHLGAKLGLKISGATSAQELAMVAASVGVASNLAALRALSTDGIQRGHMALHARSVAIAAGAREQLVELVAQRIFEARDVTIERARKELAACLGPGESLPAAANE